MILTRSDNMINNAMLILELRKKSFRNNKVFKIKNNKLEILINRLKAYVKK